MTAATLAAGDLVLTRAGADDRAAVECLQQAAYARNRERLGMEPLPLQADYGEIFRDCEVWIKAGDDADTVAAALILETDRPVIDGARDVLIWSVATQPTAQHGGLGHALLACAEVRARQLGCDRIRLYTGQPLTDLIDWYGRNGYAIERTEALPDRTIVHMLKILP